MLNATDDVVLHLREPLDEATAYEVLCKGWYNGAVAELPGGKLYPLFFYEPVRLAQELEEEAKQGVPCIAEVGMVVVPEVTEAAMLAALQRLYCCGWFEHLVPSPASSPLEALRTVKAVW